MTDKEKKAKDTINELIIESDGEVNLSVIFQKNDEMIDALQTALSLFDEVERLREGKMSEIQSIQDILDTVEQNIQIEYDKKTGKVIRAYLPKELKLQTMEEISDYIKALAGKLPKMGREELIKIMRKFRLCQLDYIKDIKSIKPHNLTDEELLEIADAILKG